MQDNKTKKNCQSKLKTSKVTFKQSLMGACTNIIYKLGVIGGLKRMPQLLKATPSNGCCVIFGQLITDKMIAKQRIAKIIWFTYREKIKIAEDLYSDVGWGCLPRVGQMMLAQTLLRHLSQKGENLDRKKVLKIIQPFLDQSEESAGYSLSMILKYARWNSGITPGDWFNIGQLSEALRKIQQQHPIKGSQNLKIVFFNQSVIFLNQLQQKSKIKKCDCSNKKILCLSCNKKIPQQINLNKQQKVQQKENNNSIIMTIEQFKEDSKDILSLPDQELKIQKQEQKQKQKCFKQKGWQIYDEKNLNQLQTQNKQQIQECKPEVLSKNNSQSLQNQLQNHLLMIVSVRIAERTIDKFDIQPIISLLQMPTSVGIIGGVPSKALYIVGHEGDDLIYLDPHYVQEHVDKSNYLQHLNTFFCTEYRTINIQALDASMAFCFYLRTLQDVQRLLVRIQQLKQCYDRNNKSFFISVMENNNFQKEQEGRDSKNQSDNQKAASFQYNSLQFRDISDSL